jgi:hypothetical protein
MFQSRTVVVPPYRGKVNCHPNSPRLWLTFWLFRHQAWNRPIGGPVAREKLAAIKSPLLSRIARVEPPSHTANIGPVPLFLPISDLSRLFCKSRFFQISDLSRFFSPSLGGLGRRVSGQPRRHRRCPNPLIATEEGAACTCKIASLASASFQNVSVPCMRRFNSNFHREERQENG